MLSEMEKTEELPRRNLGRRGFASVHEKWRRIIRYIFSGGTGAAVNLGLLYIVVHFFGFHYLVGAILSFAVAVVVSFLMQKFWTFRHFDKSASVINKQASVFLIVAVFNLGLNTLLMYLFVSIFGLWYMLGQFLASGLIAILSYFIYKLFVFQATTLR